ncbi:MAG: glycosyltransferase family 2 protein [Spirochaetes bacterium]|nr:MAG: glycosyltransferase family 2 protein [Spirochaetota bacterium]
MKLSIVVPTYNERENLPLLVKRLKDSLEGVEFEMIVVDDDSPDETWKLAEELRKDYPFIRVIRRIDEKDLSTAVLRGFEESHAEIVAVMDADLQHPPEKLRDMLNRMENADVVVGSRYVDGGEIEEWGILRKFYSKFATLLAHIFVPRSRVVKDPMSGFFMLRRDVIEDVELNPMGYKILLEILAKGKYRRVEEEAIKFRRREKGESSLNMGVQLKYIRHLIKLAWETGEIYRMMKFAAIGLTGVFVNLGILWLLTEKVGIYYLISAVFSIEASIISNYFLNDIWTFRDRKEKGIKRWMGRLAKFNVVSLPSFPMQLVVMGILKEIFGVYYILAAVVGILVVFVWNFVANSLWTWRGSD